MSKNYIRAYPNYKQQALNQITNAPMGILRETDFFRRFPQTFGYLDKFFLSYDKLYFEEEFNLPTGVWLKVSKYCFGVDVAFVLGVKK